MQEQKIEKSLAAKQFFDKNRNLTSHFESWTTPQFYQQSSEQIERSKASRRKEEELEERREKLREMRQREEQEWQREIQEARRPRNRVSTKCLSDINDHLGDEKRKSELESQLYSRWRFDSTRDKIIHDSRSAHEALAKLSWLDRQVEQNMEREKREKEVAERERRMQEETERQERLLQENRQVLDSQMRELRTMQESHMDVMRRRESESHVLKQEEEQLRQQGQKIQNLFEKWRDRVENRTKASPRPMHNLRRIKMIIETRISSVREGIQHDLDFIENLMAIVPEEDSLKPLLVKFRKHLEETANESERVRNLYDSEAKSFLLNRELVWSTMAETRERLIRHTVTELRNRLSLEMEKTKSRQQELSDIKATHLRALEHTNDLLKELTREQSTKNPPRIDLQSETSSVSATEDIPESQRKKHADECDSIVNQLSSQRITPSPRDDPQTGGVPRYGRKKIAWT